MTPTPMEPHPELYSWDAAVNGDYPAVVHEAGSGCQPCEISRACCEQLDPEAETAWRAAGQQARQLEAGL